jgi:hypothetical protein
LGSRRQVPLRLLFGGFHFFLLSGLSRVSFIFTSVCVVRVVVGQLRCLPSYLMADISAYHGIYGFAPSAA